MPFSKYKFTILINRNNFIRKWAQISSIKNELADPIKGKSPNPNHFLSLSFFSTPLFRKNKIFLTECPDWKKQQTYRCSIGIMRTQFMATPVTHPTFRALHRIEGFKGTDIHNYAERNESLRPRMRAFSVRKSLSRRVSNLISLKWAKVVSITKVFACQSDRRVTAKLSPCLCIT